MDRCLLCAQFIQNLHWKQQAAETVILHLASQHKNPIQKLPALRSKQNKLKLKLKLNPNPNPNENTKQHTNKSKSKSKCSLERTRLGLVLLPRKRQTKPDQTELNSSLAVQFQWGPIWFTCENEIAFEREKVAIWMEEKRERQDKTFAGIWPPTPI